MKRIIIYPGSFNPVHNGHLSIAKYLIDKSLCDELWLVPSPRNPLKSPAGLAPDRDRLAMVQLAVDGLAAGERVKVSGIEFDLPKPSYTIDTLRTLTAAYPQYRFSLAIGSDCLAEFDRWKDYRALLTDYEVLVYPRGGADCRPEFAGRVKLLEDAPLLEFSSTDVRERIARGESIRGMVPQGVERYIGEHKLYV